jgi:hypothetical protein
MTNETTKQFYDNTVRTVIQWLEEISEDMRQYSARIEKSCAEVGEMDAPAARQMLAVTQELLACANEVKMHAERVLKLKEVLDEMNQLNRETKENDKQQIQNN